jgi:Ca2+-binding EF-hand superfamily protein
MLALTIFAAPLPSGAEEAHKGKLSKAKQKYDADGDGMLNEEELARAKEGARAKAKETREANLAKYDADKDGKLDDEEKARKRADEQAAKEAKRKEREARRAGKDAMTAGAKEQ